MLRGSCLCQVEGRLSLGVLQGLASVKVGSAGCVAGAQASCPCRAPEPLELMLPVVLLADARVAQGSIGTPVVSISACLSLFGDAILFDGSNRWVPGGAGPQESQTPRLWYCFLSFLLKPLSSHHNGPERPPESYLLYG